MLAGGQGAPLVPLLDYVLFADPKRGRVLQNIGGIANLTAIPARSRSQAVIAFDTGPGNMVIDALAQSCSANASIATEPSPPRHGTRASTALPHLRNPYFHLKPPRTAGREQFGREYAAKFLATADATAASPKTQSPLQPH